MPPAPRSTPRSALSAAFGVLLAAAAPAGAEAEPLPPGVERLALIPGWREAEGAHVAAIEIRLAPGWHTYWRAPGPNGFPPRFDWSASINLRSVAYEWPRPEVIETYGAPAIGYLNALVLPVVLTPTTPDAPVEAVVHLSFGVCKDICIPAEAQVSLRLAPTDPAAGAAEGRVAIERAFAARPVPAAAGGVTAARCVVEAAGAGPLLTAEVTFAAPPAGGLTTVIEADGRPDVWIGAAETEIRGRVLRAAAPLAAVGAGGPALDGAALRLTLLDATRAIDIRGCGG